MAGQPKSMSLLESVINVVIGFGVAVAAQVVIFSSFGIHMPLAQNIEMAGWFTVISVIRSYCVRRLFNWWHVRSEV